MFDFDPPTVNTIYERDRPWRPSFLFWLAFIVALLIHTGGLYYFYPVLGQPNGLLPIEGVRFTVQLVRPEVKSLPAAWPINEPPPTIPPKPIASSENAQQPFDVKPKIPSAVVVSTAELNTPSGAATTDLSAKRGGTIFDPRLRDRFNNIQPVLKHYDFGGKKVETLITNHGDEIIVNNGKCLRMGEYGYYLMKCGFIKTEKEKFNHSFRQALKARGLK